MTDVAVIRQLVRRARRRIRVQALLDATVAALIPAVIVGLLGTIVLVIGPPQIAIGLFGIAIAVILAAALMATARPLEDAEVARRIDRESNLADRLATALAFADRKQPDGFELLAIADGVRAASQARVDEATRLRVPPATPIAAGVVVVALAAGTIAVPPLARMQADDVVAEASNDEHELDFYDPLYGPFEHPIERVRQVAWNEGNPGLVAIAEELTQHVRAFGRHGMTKDHLLVKLVELERLAARLQLTRRAQLALAQAGDSIRKLAEPASPAPAPEQVDVLAGVADAQGVPIDEAVVTSAHRGNANAEYKKVYQQYQRQLEETQHNEKVPAAYRAYVKRYFDKIKSNR